VLKTGRFAKMSGLYTGASTSCTGSSTFSVSTFAAACANALESGLAGCGALLLAGATFLSTKPVAMMVISISFLSGTNAVPRMMFALGSTTCFTMSQASVTSPSNISSPPVMLTMIPVAPSISVSSNGLKTAPRTASITLFSPLP